MSCLYKSTYKCPNIYLSISAEALQILNKYNNVVFVDKLSDSTIKYPPMKATLTKPFHGVPPRRLNKTKQDFLDTWLDSALERGIIRPSASTTTSPLLLVPKGPDNFRVTQDVSQLNACLAQIHAHIPVTRELVGKIGGHEWYVQNDMCDCYYQFLVAPEVAALYAFSTHRGNFEYCDVLPQGEKNAPAWTNNAMAHMFAPLAFLAIYFDDHVFGNSNPKKL